MIRFAVPSLKPRGRPARSDKNGAAPRQSALRYRGEMSARCSRVELETTLTELAEELGITHQAMSGRLRRGLETLVDGTLMTDIDVLSEQM